MDDLDEDRNPEAINNEKFSVNLAQENTDKRVETHEKYGPAGLDRSRSAKFEKPGIGYWIDTQSIPEGYRISDVLFEYWATEVIPV